MSCMGTSAVGYSTMRTSERSCGCGGTLQWAVMSKDHRTVGVDEASSSKGDWSGFRSVMVAMGLNGGIS